MISSIAETRPTTFRACLSCAEATKHLKTAQEAVAEAKMHTTIQLTAVCSDIQGKTDAYPGTAEMQVLEISAEGEAGTNTPVKIEAEITRVIVYCEGALQG